MLGLTICAYQLYSTETPIFEGIMKKPQENLDYSKALQMFANYLHTLTLKPNYALTAKEIKLIRTIRTIYNPFFRLTSYFRPLDFPCPELLDMDETLKQSIYEHIEPYIKDILRANELPPNTPWIQTISTANTPTVSWESILEEDLFAYAEEDSEDNQAQHSERFDKKDRILSLLDYLQTKYSLANQEKAKCDPDVKLLILEINSATRKIMANIETNLATDDYFSDEFLDSLSPTTIERLDAIAQLHKDEITRFKDELNEFYSPEKKVETQEGTTTSEENSDDSSDSENRPL